MIFLHKINALRVWRRGPFLKEGKNWRKEEFFLQVFCISSCGQRGHSTTMNKPSAEAQTQTPSLQQKQRDVFARLLEEAKKREQAELESASDLDEVEAETLGKLAEERGASQLAAKLGSLNKEVEETEEALANLGFSYNGDRLSLKWDAPKDLRRALEAAKSSARKERNAALKRYDRAILGVWAAESVAEAKQIVEQML